MTPSIYPSIKHKILEPFSKKLKRTKNIIKMFSILRPNLTCISCSFGKDSMTVLYLVKELNPNVDVVFCNTLCQYPETYKFKNKILEEWNLNLIETKPETMWWKVWDKYGAPDGSKKLNGKSVDRCCYYLKEKPFKESVKKKKRLENKFYGINSIRK